MLVSDQSTSSTAQLLLDVFHYCRCPADKIACHMEDLAAAVAQSQDEAVQQVDQQLGLLKDQVAAIGGSKADAAQVDRQHKAARCASRGVHQPQAGLPSARAITLLHLYHHSADGCARAPCWTQYGNQRCAARVVC
jgi:hypothetical protein